MSDKKIKFSVEEEQKIIDFVKNHQILHNKKNRDSTRRNRLWKELSTQIDKDPEEVKKKWKIIRDYFLRKKKAAASAAPTVNRDESLMFLLDESKLKRKTPSHISTSASDSTISSEEEIPNKEFGEKTLADVDGSCESSVSVQFDEAPRQSKKRRRVHQTDDSLTEVLREFVNRKQSKRPPKDSLQQFFESIASTMRTFSPLSIAKIKYQIGIIVGKEEMAYAERNAKNNAIMDETIEIKFEPNNDNILSSIN